MYQITQEQPCLCKLSQFPPTGKCVNFHLVMRNSLKKSLRRCVIQKIMYFRYKSMGSPTEWKPDSVLIKYLHVICVGYILYGVTLVVISGIYDLRMFNIYNCCMMKPANAVQNNFPLLAIFVLIPQIGIMVASAAMDTSCFIFVKHNGKLV